MPSSSVHHFQGSSPHSSAGSATGTPETRLTAFSPFSPENQLNKSISERIGVAFSSSLVVPSGLRANTMDSLDKDPFVSQGKYEQKLSPTASAFQPFALRTGEGASYSPMVVQSPGSTATIRGTKIPREKLTNTEPASPASSQASGITQQGTFSTDTGATRALKVSGISAAVQVDLLNNLILAYRQEKRNRPKSEIEVSRFGIDGFLRFSDVTDAINIYSQAKLAHRDWNIEFISPAAFAEKSTPRAPFVSAHEGQIILTATFPSNGGYDRTKLESIILDILKVDGAVYAYQKQLATEAGTFRLLAEYSDVNSAVRAIERLNGTTIRGIKISVGFHKPDLNSSSPHRPGLPATPTRAPGDQQDLVSGMDRISISTPSTFRYPLSSPVYDSILSPTGRSFVPTQFLISPPFSGLQMPFNAQFSPAGTTVIGYTPPGVHFSPSHFGADPGFLPPMGPWCDLGSPGRAQPCEVPNSNGRFSGRRQGNTRSGNRSYANSLSGQHNIVDIDRIRAGLDVRTTIMLRNIPNKIDQVLLKSIIDQTSFGLYDFMYLRIDFANNCNVGYAFINFEDPWHIINFVKARAGQRWNRYNSDKVAEVSYATIQGKDCLVQKFRNSSVMLEHPGFRPKIFFTRGHPRAGQEEDFPLPDNASKMRRSVENAEHVGLFAPRAGQHYREEQRRRHSQYDRGTPLAALEEFDYEDSMNQDSGSHYTY